MEIFVGFRRFLELQCPTSFSIAISFNLQGEIKMMIRLLSILGALAFIVFVSFLFAPTPTESAFTASQQGIVHITIHFTEAAVPAGVQPPVQNQPSVPSPVVQQPSQEPTPQSVSPIAAHPDPVIVQPTPDPVVPEPAEPLVTDVIPPQEVTPPAAAPQPAQSSDPDPTQSSDPAPATQPATQDPNTPSTDSEGTSNEETSP
jgi:outer membrane biosynthesis protein TonB